MASVKKELRVADLVELFGLPDWTVRRLFTIGLFPGAHRYPRGVWRLPADRLDEARKALKKAGYAT